jgi:hypothetical protein
MAFWPGQRTCGDDRVFAVGTNAEKLVSRVFGGVFSRHRASKMEIPVNHPNYSAVNSSVTSSSFGQFTSALDPRILQFPLKLHC